MSFAPSELQRDELPLEREDGAVEDLAFLGRRWRRLDGSYESKAMSAAEAAGVVGISRRTLYLYLAELRDSKSTEPVAGSG